MWRWNLWKAPGNKQWFSLESAWPFLVTQTVKNLPAVQETQVRSLGWKDPLEKGMATHSSILPWKNPWTEELGRLYSPRGCKEWDPTAQLTLPRVS